MTEEKRYGQWSGNEKGNPEDKTKCFEEIGFEDYVGRQCSRKRGYGPGGLYCKTHAKYYRKENDGK